MPSAPSAAAGKPVRVLPVHLDAVLAVGFSPDGRALATASLDRSVRVVEVETGLESLTLLVEPGASPMCGNSICQDRRFLARHMPTLEKFFHYRNLDVSTLKELARRWAPSIIPGFSKQGTHQALADIQESIRELAYYREHFLAPEFQKL